MMNILNTMELDERLYLSQDSYIIKSNDGFVNEYGNTVKLNPNAMKPLIYRDFLSYRTHGDIKEFVENRPFIFQSDDVFGRDYLKSHIMFDKLHQSLTPIVCEMLQQDVMPSYNFLSMYDDRGICPIHTDKDTCAYTLCYVIGQDEPWPLYIDGEEIILNTNDAVLYSGSDNTHFRKHIPGKYHWNVLFHFTPQRL